MKIADIDQLKINSLLPSSKGIAQALLEACQQKDVTYNEIAKLIQTDSSLCSYLIHLVNASNQTAHVITSLSEAVSRVGLPVIKQLVRGFSLIDQYQNGSCKGFNYQEFWSHSLLMALAMQELGKTTRVCAQDELFACGLMARIGCLALATTHPEEYAELAEKQDSSISLVALEQQSLQTDHNQLTAAMLIDFGIPMILVEAVYYHEVPTESGFSEGSYPFQLVNLVHLAKQIADLGLASESERTNRISELMLLGSKIGLDAESFGSLIDKITQEWHSCGKILKIKTANLPSFHKMVSASAPSLEMTTNDTPLRVLLVEDDPFGLEIAEEVLSNTLGHTVFSASNGKQALSLIMDIMPHIIVTDWAMPVMDGLELTRSLRAADWGQNIYIIMLTGYEDDKKIAEAFEAGVNDYVTKPINVPAFRARLRAAWHYKKLRETWERDRAYLKRFAAELAITNHKLKHAALTDMLTGIPNRRAGMKALTGIWNNAKRSGQSIAVMLIDIDHFKKINDTYGHAIGDKVLKEVATSIRNITRKGEIFCRIGGEEFLMICPNGCTDAKSVFPLAERLRQHVRMQEINIDEIRIQISISIGIALKDAAMKSDEQLVKAADKALYAAKNAGRDRVYLAIENQLISSNFY
ncbi:diguanylate cyclase [Nitrosomonas sp. Is37]|uniref:GGDEF domain-containing response regulator n=1 Tax=Nitrosomonas sp. Is37 TaxID=3080535 RepID=UPI00294B5494|nr:diguanylate cyclase [Nitrosomonas sp. Is37]MDV6345176.1 diguanylate cyclase [Nitrosomonas sp. Is37]